LLVALLVLVPSLLLNVFLLNKKGRDRLEMPVIGVIDGDTIVLEGKVRLRLRQVDAPELEFCGGEEAKKFLEKMVTGKKVGITEEIIDQQGRAMALLWLEDKMVNEEMIRAGWGRYHHDVSSQEERLKVAWEEAKAQKQGVYSPTCYQQEENLENPNCVIKGNIDKSTKTRIYYLPDCAQYKFTIVEKDLGEAWFCTEKEAQAAGYVKSKNCVGKSVD